MHGHDSSPTPNPMRIDLTEEAYIPRCFLRARPIRVAFLVEDDEHAGKILDAAFANSHSRWGGRYSLVVPCVSGMPRPVWLPWLDAYDPDVIYAYTDLDDTTAAKVHERFGPAFLIKHRARGDGHQRDFRPELPLECLTSLSVAPQYAQVHPPSAPQPMLVVDYLPGQPSDRFIDENLGTPFRCFERWPLPHHLADVLRPITLASKDLLADPGHAVRPTGDTVPDAAALLRFMAERPNSFGLAQLAADSAPRVEVRGRHREALSLVVGDTFADRVLFWNDRSLMPAFLGRHFTTLIVSPKRLEEEEFFKALVEFLKARNGISRSHGTPWIEMTSVSLDAEVLTRLRDRFNEADNWNGYHVIGPVALDDVVPDAQALDRIAGLSTGRAFGRPATWSITPAEGAEFRPPSTLPDQIRGMQNPSPATEGAWALDLDIERQNNLTRYSNVRHRWRLPRRLRMHGAFCQPYEGSADRRLRYPRSTREGFLSVFTDFGEEPPVILLPDDETAFRYALERGRDWPPSSRAERGNAPSGPYRWSRPSDKGRYAIGVLRRFGGLQNCGAVFLHSFWKSIFEDLGGAIGTSQNDTIKRTLKKRFPDRQMNSEEDWDRLVDLVGQQAHQVRMPSRVLDFDALRKRHEPFVDKERRLLEDRQADGIDEWIEDTKTSLIHSLQWLCARSILYQGYEWRCRTCYNSNWTHIGALEPVMACEVCGTNQIAPVENAWQFRLDGFLRDALKEYGMLALVWCLIKLEKRVQQTFYFLGPHDLFKKIPENDRATVDNEIDLLCVLDGKVHLCEVKTSDHRLRIDSVVEVAKQIRPDVVSLAILNAKSNRLIAKLKELRHELSGEGIEVELLTLTDDDYCDFANLPG